MCGRRSSSTRMPAESVTGSGDGAGAVRGGRRPHAGRVDAVVAAVAVGAGRRAERGDGAARRRRVRAVRLLRVGHRHADVRPPGRRRAALQQLPHHRAVLADAGLPADRPQPPRQRDGADRRVRLRLPRLRRDDAEGQRVPVRGPRPQRLRHVRRRQVAPGAGAGDGDGSVRASAGRSAAASSASTGSSPARPTSTTPISSTTTTRSIRRARRRTATTSPRTSPTGRSATSTTSGRRRPTDRSSSTSLPARAMRRTRCRARTGSATAVASTRGGTGGARRCSPASRRPACCPPAPG